MRTNTDDLASSLCFHFLFFNFLSPFRYQHCSLQSKSHRPLLTGLTNMSFSPQKNTFSKMHLKCWYQGIGMDLWGRLSAWTAIYLASKTSKFMDSTLGIDVHRCVLKTHLLSLIKKSVIERHNVIFDANLVLYLQLEQLMCESDSSQWTALGAPEIKEHVFSSCLKYGTANIIWHITEIRKPPLVYRHKTFLKCAAQSSILCLSCFMVLMDVFRVWPFFQCTPYVMSILCSCSSSSSSHFIIEKMLQQEVLGWTKRWSASLSNCLEEAADLQGYSHYF